MDMEELDVTTLSAKDLRISEAQRLELEPNEEISLLIETVRAYKTEYGILFNLIGHNALGTFSISSWNIVVKPRVTSILELQNKMVRVKNTGAKKYTLEH